MPRPTPSTRETRAAAPAPAPALDQEGGVRFSMANAALIAAGLVSIIAGFVLLSGGSNVAAPLLLVLGFVVLIPLGIIK